MFVCGRGTVRLFLGRRTRELVRSWSGRLPRYAVICTPERRNIKAAAVSEANRTRHGA